MDVLDRTALIDATLPSGYEHLAPLLTAVRSGAINLALIRRKTPTAVFGASPDHRPFVVLVGDDRETSFGPDGFDGGDLIAAAKAASHVVVYSGAADPDFYQFFVIAATLGRLALVVETQPRHHEEWKRFLVRHAPNAALLDIAPPAQGRA